MMRHGGGAPGGRSRPIAQAPGSRHGRQGLGCLVASLLLLTSSCSKGTSANAATNGMRAFNIAAANFQDSGMSWTIPAGDIQLSFTKQGWRAYGPRVRGAASDRHDGSRHHR
jgi:hypothetical protein